MEFDEYIYAMLVDNSDPLSEERNEVPEKSTCDLIREAERLIITKETEEAAILMIESLNDLEEDHLNATEVEFALRRFRQRTQDRSLNRRAKVLLNRFTNIRELAEMVRERAQSPSPTETQEDKTDLIQKEHSTLPLNPYRSLILPDDAPKCSKDFDKGPSPSIPSCNPYRCNKMSTDPHAEDKTVQPDSTKDSDKTGAPSIGEEKKMRTAHIQKDTNSERKRKLKTRKSAKPVPKKAEPTSNLNLLDNIIDFMNNR